MQNSRMAYAAAFCSYLIERADGIRSVILFGSASRGEAGKESDIDIFIDSVYLKNSQIKAVIKGFYESQIAKSWNLKGIKNPISVLVGDLESKEWVDLKRSIITDGIILFGKYKSKPEMLKHCVLFSYQKIKDPKKRVNLHRKLFGYKLNNKKYEGLVSKFHGIKHGSGSFSVPIEHYNEIRDLFKKMKITSQIMDIWIG